MSSFWVLDWPIFVADGRSARRSAPHLSGDRVRWMSSCRPAPSPFSLCVCVRARLIIHLSYQRMDGCIPYTLSLSARHGEMENPVACTYPDAISSFPPLSLSHLANSHLPSSLMIEWCTFKSRGHLLQYGQQEFDSRCLWFPSLSDTSYCCHWFLVLFVKLFHLLMSIERVA